MNLTVNGKGIDVGEALRTHVGESLDRVLEKYFSNPIDATTTFSKQGHLFKVQISVHVGRGILTSRSCGSCWSRTSPTPPA